MFVWVFMADQVFTIDIRRALFEIHGFGFTIEMQGCTDQPACESEQVEVLYCKKKKKTKSVFRYFTGKKPPKKVWIFVFFAVH